MIASPGEPWPPKALCVCVCVCARMGRCAIYDQRQHTLSLPRSAPTCGTDVVFSTHGVPGEGC